MDLSGCGVSGLLPLRGETAYFRQSSCFPICSFAAEIMLGG